MTGSVFSRCRVSLAFGIGIASAALAQNAPAKRAVVIGIDHYRAAMNQPLVTASAGRIQPKGPVGQRNWSDLDGAVNDAESVRAVLIGRFGFMASEIVTLENEQATANAILGAIQKHLIDDAEPGDISVFFYAGHGSRIRNMRTTEIAGFDQTIVPADAPRGTPDIRDKELARYFRRGVTKGVVLTAIFDSCHSGSIARGHWNIGTKSREMEPDSRYVEDPPDVDAAGRPLVDPEAAGMLVLSAAQDFQAALETETDSGSHGLFTWALVRVLQTAPPNERANRIFLRVRAVMQSEGTLQEPVLAGSGSGDKSLIGLKPDGVNALTAAVDTVWDNTVRLQAGAGIGLNKGCELRKVASLGQGRGARIRVSKVTGLSSSEAVILDGGSDIHESDLFQVVHWTAPDSATLRVFIPRIPATLAELSGMASAMYSLRGRIHWIDDPSVESPTHVMSWSGNSWILERNPAVGEPVDLGAHPSPAAVAGLLPPDARFLLLLPAPLALATEIQVGPGSPNDAIRLETSPERAHYVLYGRYADGKVTYAWVLPNATETELAERFASAEQSGSLPPAMAMPIRSDWLTRACDLTEAAGKLGRIHGWLQIDSPVDAVRFPYHLALREGEGRPLITGGTVRENQEFELVIAADQDRLRASVDSDSLASRWIYVFAMDRNGNSTLLFPPEGRGNVENRFPPSGSKSAPPVIFKLGTRAPVQIVAPFGLDTYFLLASEEPLQSPEILAFSGVRNDVELRGGLDTLDRFLSLVGDSRRGSLPAVPTNWSVERVILRSVGGTIKNAPTKK